MAADKFTPAMRRRSGIIRSARALAIAIAVLYLAPLYGVTLRPVPLIVSAAISLKGVLDDLGAIYQRSDPGVKITFNYGASGTLQRQIEQGAPVDIFISAGTEQSRALDSEGLLLGGTLRDLAGNELVLIVPASAKSIGGFADLERPEIRVVALGEPATVPAGMYARQTLEHLGLLGAVAGKAVYAKDVLQVLTYVETGNADAGIVYRTDAQGTPHVRIAATAQPGWHDPIVYPAAVVKGTRHPTAAIAFLNFLASAPARTVFAQRGFSIPENQPTGH